MNTNTFCSCQKKRSSIFSNYFGRDLESQQGSGEGKTGLEIHRSISTLHTEITSQENSNECYTIDDLDVIDEKIFDVNKQIVSDSIRK